MSKRTAGTVMAVGTGMAILSLMAVTATWWLPDGSTVAKPLVNTAVLWGLVGLVSAGISIPWRIDE